MESITYYTNDELRQLFKSISSLNKRDRIRDEALIKVAYYCGLRISEIGLIEITSFNNQTNELYCKRLKGSNSNTIKIQNTDVLRSLKRHLRNLNIKQGYLFCSNQGKPISRSTIHNLFKEYCNHANLERKSNFHVLKHTRAVDLAQAGMDIKEIQYWLGHKNIENTLIYFKFTYKQYEYMYKKLGEK